MMTIKKVWILLFQFTVILPVVGQKNNYIPFPSNMIAYGYIGHATSDQGFYSVFRTEIHGDTLFNGVHYSKYYNAEKYPISGNTFPPSGTDGFAKLVGGIRNDAATKKVYFYSLATNQETLLYDFDLQVGDTLFKNQGYGSYQSLLSPLNGVKIDTAWVSRIDSVRMPHDGLYHKRFNFNARLRTYGIKEVISSDTIIRARGYEIKIDPLIEGVGVMYNPVRLLLAFEYAWDLQLRCLSIDGKTIYSASGGGTPPPFINPKLCGSIFTGIEKNDDVTKISIYPNPSNGKFNLLTKGLKNGFFEIKDILGKTIFKSKTENDVTEIDLTSWVTGIYFIYFYNADGIIGTKKLILN